MPYIARLVGGDAVLVTVMSAMAPHLVFSVGMDAVGGYRIAPWRCRIHRSEFGGDAVGIRVLQRGSCIVKNDFGGDAVARDAARQRCREWSMSCGELRRVAGLHWLSVGTSAMKILARSPLPRVGGEASVKCIWQGC